MITHLSKAQTYVSWTLQLVAAGILLQTLFFKFTAAEESVYIFTTLGLEPWGRIARRPLSASAGYAIRCGPHRRAEGRTPKDPARTLRPAPTARSDL